ncbi:MFS transporter [Brevibacillus humidisoli]|uniref:MDR family MFS transporter n=1 Tax=Brevibacillus humidisoli TaxID=2895522 RepID=UPI001E62022C|nr:MFS transporter [Brevibacillus humidisoli]UFJ39821.1 MFS transporter [Brevibacillus humidisoli]
MSRWQGVLKRYDTAIWVRVFGTVLTTLTGFMLRPFLVLYLYDKLDGSILLPMVVVGLQPLTGILVTLWGGGLTDRYGRKPLMVTALIVQTLSMTGFIFAESVWEFAALTLLNGFGMALFFPAANAQVTDVVPEEQRAEVFALLHTALNVGAACGPLLGLALFTQSPALVFSCAAAASLVYLLTVLWKIPETLPADLRLRSLPVSRHPKMKLTQHKPLLWMTLFATPIGLLYAYTESVLPLHLKANFVNYETVFVWLMTINGTTVILLQIWLTKKTEHLALHNVILVAYLLFATVAFGYGFGKVFILLALIEIVFTIGEMLVGPHMQKAVSILAPPEMRGRYFSIYGLNWQVAKAVGPLFGGVLLSAFGGELMFSVVAVLLLVSGLAQYRLLRQLRHDSQVKATVSTATRTG